MVTRVFKNESEFTQIVDLGSCLNRPHVGLLFNWTFLLALNLELTNICQLLSFADLGCSLVILVVNHFWQPIGARMTELTSQFDAKLLIW